MNHNEKLYNSFRLAKTDILELQKELSELSMTQERISEYIGVMNADNQIFWEHVLMNYNGHAVKKHHPSINPYATNLHVVPRGNAWAVLSEGRMKAAKVFKNQSEAAAFAKERATRNKTCVVTHDKDGTFKRVDCR